MSTDDPLKNWQLEDRKQPDPEQWKLEDSDQDLSKHLQLQEGETSPYWQPVEYERAPQGRRNWVLPSVLIVALLAVLGETADWLERSLKRHKGRLIRKNVQTTLCELTAVSIVEAIRRHAPAAQEVLVCGGGVHNLALMFRLQLLLGETQLKSTEDYGLPPQWIEAMAFAWLAHETLAGRPGNLPSVTGAEKPVLLGGIYRTARRH